ncbi:endonuclease MutS2 [Gorillibacterium timonense]|uniref:endonuclease MutS2 n=1 Tax=Gorillibacterium timonense TaxID=1689269 RepID=UPI000ACA9BD9|nr:DNA mismatch repair protein MutS [Gorillibacterium timonense]
MNPETLTKLEYPRVIAELEELAVSFAGKEIVRKLAPLPTAKLAADAMSETEEAKRIVERSSGLPLPTLQGMEAPLALIGKGYILSLEDLGQIALFLRGVGQWKRYMLQREDVAPRIGSYARSLYELKVLLEELESSIQYGQLIDSASPELGKIRRKIRTEEERLKRRIDSLLGKYRSYLQEALVSKRGDRFVLPIKKEFRKQVPGVVLDESSSGQTVFIEPAELAPIQAELSSLHADESVEEDRIRSKLTGSVEAVEAEIRLNVEVIGQYDFLFAKAKYAHRIQGRKVTMNEHGHIRLIQATHPFLQGTPVPLDIRVGEDYRALIITGPNTGGKTVSLKTIGLLTLMAQSGLLVPASEESELSVFSLIEADIGDNQSLDESLSTFSAHMRNILRMLRTADSRTLILLDELAAGTDPGEGVGLSIAVLEELARRGAVILASTHFGEIKTFAAETKGFENARMEFDPDTLRPLYRLTIGEAGHSYAFQIAAKLGMSSAIIERAKELSARRSTEKAESHMAIPPIPSKDDSEANGSHGDESPYSVQVNLTPNPHRKRKSKRKKDRLVPTATQSDESEGEAPKEQKWKIGDRVFIPHLKQSGVIFRLADERGNLLLLVKKEKLLVNVKRIKPFIDRKHLYPEDYDMDIVFESKENRKNRNQLRKHHVEGLTIETKEEQWKKLH